MKFCKLIILTYNSSGSVGLIKKETTSPAIIGKSDVVKELLSLPDYLALFFAAPPLFAEDFFADFLAVDFLAVDFFLADFFAAAIWIFSFLIYFVNLKVICN